ncbi:alpha-xenorhabdolysin family binary toxin subunit A [Nodularia sp. UHCC 0506]|uniref:alpha-xenorhabdolysin family binary toxin subunit A n=1 Tax=Nodularia sp. UHCC 0506 TaxID=3110243 RepID=UPI002B201767|nr:alpha-xenorhabdolysin family binary toxin subunit A [Nodularia sp. UHCC 0506]MEA5514724.1 alpha-xenorhabdolysin family binary toxin subunit A [Nodularia sp. UHCC 0506]
MTVTTVDIGPKQLAENTTSAPEGFVIDSEQLFQVQLFVANALELPITKDKMQFDDIREAYSLIHKHCSEWQSDIYPSIVSLATDIYDYGTSAQTIYGAIGKLATQISESDDMSLSSPEVKKFYRLVDNLIAKATDYEQRAIKVSDDVTRFSNYCHDHDRNLDKLYVVYEAKFIGNNQKIKELQNQKKVQEDRLAKANADYHHYVVVAATTPTYMWIPLVGWIAGGVVLGIYIDRAVKAKNDAEDAARQIVDLIQKLSDEVRVVSEIEKAKKGVHDIDKQLETALEALGKIQSAWSAIAADLTKLKVLVADVIAHHNNLIVADIYIDDAILKWKNLAEKADTYRMKAYANFLPKTA